MSAPPSGLGCADRVRVWSEVPTCQESDSEAVDSCHQSLCHLHPILQNLMAAPAFQGVFPGWERKVYALRQTGVMGFSSKRALS